MPIKTKKRIQRAGDTKCKVSSKFKGADKMRYTRDALRRVLEDNNFLMAKNSKDQNNFMGKIIPSIISKATKGITNKNPPYIKPSIICLKCLNNSKLHQLIYDNLTIMYKEKNEEGKKEEVPASEDETTIRIRGITNFINFVLVPALKEYKTETSKSSKTEEILSKELSSILGENITLESSNLAETNEASIALAKKIIDNKDKIEAHYEKKMMEKIQIKSCNPNDEEDADRCGEQGKNPAFFLYLVTSLFAFALIFEFSG